jgi:nucleoside-diphosphate-sugar epimerase
MAFAPPPIARPVLTGASGFVGAALAARLPAAQHLAFGAANWRESLAAQDLRGATVFHLAARVHQRSGESVERDFDADNIAKTLALAQAAAAAGAARFVFASTVKVCGEETTGVPWTPRTAADPRDAYARSKWRAEEGLREIARHSGLACAVVRFPLVYGPAVGGNFQLLLRLADRGAWLPFDAIANRRSLLHLDDAVDALLAAGTHEAAIGCTFIAAHPDPVSTPALVECLRRHLARPRRLFAMPPGVLESAAALLGQGERMRRLTRSLVVDPSDLARAGWNARVALDDGVRHTVMAFRNTRVA